MMCMEKLRVQAKKLKKYIPTVFLCMKYSDTPVCAKLLAAVTVAYALSPIDLVPDFIPVLGYLDDLILLPALVAGTIALIPKEIWNRNYAKAETLWEEGRPKKWYYAVPIILIWALLLWLILKAVLF